MNKGKVNSLVKKNCEEMKKIVWASHNLFSLLKKKKKPRET